MINGCGRKYVHTNLPNFDAFLIILILSGIPCGVIPDFIHHWTEWGWVLTHGVAVHFKCPINEQLRILHLPWYLACWFHCICATSMPDFIEISFKQAPWLKFDSLKIVSGRSQENIGGVMFSSSQQLSTAYIGIKCLLDMIQKHDAIINRAGFNSKWLYLWWKRASH